MQKGVGSAPNFVATESAIGNAKAAAALFVISSVMMFVTMYITASIVYGETSSQMPIINSATASATPETLIARLIAKAEAIVIRMSHEINFVYFFAGKIFVQAIITATTAAR